MTVSGATFWFAVLDDTSSPVNSFSFYNNIVTVEIRQQGCAVVGTVASV